jgi:hypothetical protein
MDWGFDTFYALFYSREGLKAMNEYYINTSPTPSLPYAGID